MLEEEWEAIRDEALAVLKQRDAVPPLKEISPDHARLAAYDSIAGQDHLSITEAAYEVQV